MHAWGRCLYTVHSRIDDRHHERSCWANSENSFFLDSFCIMAAVRCCMCHLKQSCMQERKRENFISSWKFGTNFSSLHWICRSGLTSRSHCRFQILPQGIFSIQTPALVPNYANVLQYRYAAPIRQETSRSFKICRKRHFKEFFAPLQPCRSNCTERTYTYR